jgi:DNA uptake protein ComE-like DNA-binding protein
MTSIRMIRLPRLALRAAAPLVVVALAACQPGSGDAERTGTAAAAASGAPLPAPTAQGDSGTGAGVTPTTAAAPATAAGAGAMLDPNAATREELAAVPGLTAPAVDALVAGRPYQTMVAVDQALAKHVGAAERKTAYARLWKPIDLNKASGDEMLLIPGVGARMRHEFEEYRPYRSMEQFRREIGKYVDKEELARLERYVAIR